MNTTRSSWASQAEAAIRSLRDVDGVRIRTEGDEILEIHVLSSSRRPAKQIVRDIQTLLLTRFQRPIDHRVVSVAFTDVHAEDTKSAEPARPALDAEPLSRRESSGRPASGPADEANPAESGTMDRIRFVSVNLYVTGRRAQAQVELRWKGVSRMASASGWSTRDGAIRLIAQATLATVQEFLEDHVALGLDSVEVVRAGRNDVALVALELLAHRAQKSLAGCCTVDDDVQEAVVLATLSALNRIVGGLPTREPTEYVLRPASS